MTLVLHDLLPRFGGGYRGARPGAIAAAVERIILEKMLSVGMTAQARMMCNGPAQAAAGWSAAEDGVYKAARALNLLAQASARIAKTFAEDTRFNDDRAYGEITPEPRLETLAQQAIFSTDRYALKDTADRRVGEEAFQEQVWKHVHENARKHHAYMDATVERLRRYEPDWLTLEQHQASLAAAEEAGKAPLSQRELDEAAHPDPDRTNTFKTQGGIDAFSKAQIEKMKQRVDVGATDAPPISGAVPPAPAAPPEPVPAKKRGAQTGNVLALKTGRHTARAKAERAEDSAMLKDVRGFCSEIDRLMAEQEEQDEQDAYEAAHGLRPG